MLICTYRGEVASSFLTLHAGYEISSSLINPACILPNSASPSHPTSHSPFIPPFPKLWKHPRQANHAVEASRGARRDFGSSLRRRGCFANASVTESSARAGRPEWRRGRYNGEGRRDVSGLFPQAGIHEGFSRRWLVPRGWKWAFKRFRWETQQGVNGSRRAVEETRNVPLQSERRKTGERERERERMARWDWERCIGESERERKSTQTENVVRAQGTHMHARVHACVTASRCSTTSTSPPPLDSLFRKVRFTSFPSERPGPGGCFFSSIFASASLRCRGSNGTRGHWDPVSPVEIEKRRNW